MSLPNVIHYPDTNSVEATWVDAEGVQIKCHSYADVQMDMLREDLGDDAATYADLIALVEANIQPAPPVQLDAVKATLIAAVQAHLDAAAQSAGYDDIKAAATYADEPTVPRFQAEGRALRAWRSLVWAYCYTVLAQVEANSRPVPTKEQLLADLPVLVMP